MSFHEIRLPDNVERGARGGPAFNTTVIQLASGFEQRNGEWQFARHTFDIGYGIDDKEAYQAVQEFFLARRGRLFGFRFKDWSDYVATTQPIGTGDGVLTQFQLSKTYSDAGGTYNRPITKPVSGTVRVFEDGVETMDFTVDTTTGVVTMNTAPALNVAMTATFEFDVPVRFETDEQTVQLSWEDAGSISAIQLVELRVQLQTLT